MVVLASGKGGVGKSTTAGNIFFPPVIVYFARFVILCKECLGTHCVIVLSPTNTDLHLCQVPLQPLRTYVGTEVLALNEVQTEQTALK